MDRLNEIWERAEAVRPIRQIDVKYLLGEIDRLNTALSEMDVKPKQAVERICNKCYLVKDGILCMESKCKWTEKGR